MVNKDDPKPVWYGPTGGAADILRWYAVQHNALPDVYEEAMDRLLDRRKPPPPPPAASTPQRSAVSFFGLGHALPGQQQPLSPASVRFPRAEHARDHQQRLEISQEAATRVAIDELAAQQNSLPRSFGLAARNGQLILEAVESENKLVVDSVLEDHVDSLGALEARLETAIERLKGKLGNVHIHHEQEPGQHDKYLAQRFNKARQATWLSKITAHATKPDHLIALTEPQAFLLGLCRQFDQSKVQPLFATLPRDLQRAPFNTWLESLVERLEADDSAYLKLRVAGQAEAVRVGLVATRAMAATLTLAGAFHKLSIVTNHHAFGLVAELDQQVRRCMASSLAVCTAAECRLKELASKEVLSIFGRFHAALTSFVKAYSAPMAIAWSSVSTWMWQERVAKQWERTTKIDEMKAQAKLEANQETAKNRNATQAAEARKLAQEEKQHSEKLVLSAAMLQQLNPTHSPVPLALAGASDENPHRPIEVDEPGNIHHKPLPHSQLPLKSGSEHIVATPMPSSATTSWAKETVGPIFPRVQGH